MMLSGQVDPGEKLPREKELAARLGLSRSSMREAVRALILAGVLKTRQGDGTYVTSLEPHQLPETMSLAVDFMQNRTLVELFEVRRLIEPAATALAAGRMSPRASAWRRACSAWTPPRVSKHWSRPTTSSTA